MSALRDNGNGNGAYGGRRRRSSDDDGLQQQRQSGMLTGVATENHVAAGAHCDETVHDSYSIVYIIIFLLGVGVLLPWNIFITETAYFNSRVHVKPYPPELANNFESLFATVFQICSFLTLSLYVLFQKRIPMALQVPFPLFVQFVLMLLTVLSVYQGKNMSGDEMLSFVLPGLALSGVCSAMLQGGAIALVAVFPAVYMQAVLSGMALAGLLVSASSFVACLLARTDDGGGGSGGQEAAASAAAAAAAAAQESIDSAAYMNFVAGLSILALCCVLFVVLQMLPFARHYLRKAHLVSSGAENEGSRQQLLGQPGHSSEEHAVEGARWGADEAVEWKGNTRQYHASAGLDDGAGTAHGDVESAANEELPLLQDLKQSLLHRRGSKDASVSSLDASVASAESDKGRGGSGTVADVLHILYKIRYHFSSVVLTFVTTLSVFPGVIALIVSEKNTARPPASLPPAGPMYGDCFVPLLFVLFNATDLIGRLSGGLWSAKPPSMRRVLRMVCSRAVLVPLVCMCNVVSRNPVKNGTDGNGWGLPVLFHDDISCFVLVVLVGLTNGLPVSVAMMHAPAELKEDEIETGGALMAWAIVLGVASGSSLSLLLSASLSQ